VRENGTLSWATMLKVLVGLIIAAKIALFGGASS
jgi:hypothetical protein